MIIAVASGKGGTGKTTVSIAIAQSVKASVVLADCDVETPNTAIFLQTAPPVTQPIKTPTPQLNPEKCTACGACADFCQFNAIAVAGTSAMVFDELCHRCGGCALICPSGAIQDVLSPIGEKSTSRTHDGHRFVEGRLRVGNSLAPGVIRSVKRDLPPEKICILDAPPGTACPMVTTVSDADYVILVTEPTPFGLNDLKLAVDTVRELQRPFGVIVNKADPQETCIRSYCKQQNIPLLMEIPESMDIARAYSEGKPLLQAQPSLAGEFQSLLSTITRETQA